jgi:acetyl esterase/lipase
LRQAGNAQTTTSDPHLAVDKDVSYGIGPNARCQTLDVVYHKDATKRPRQLFLIHGGGWISGDKRMGDCSAITADFARRLRGGLHQLPSFYGCPFPACLEDCKLAVRWLRANAARYGVDPGQLELRADPPGLTFPPSLP